MTQTTPRYFSKSQFTRGMQCSKSLYLYRAKTVPADPITPDLQDRFDAGNRVGVLAQKWLPGGVIIKADHTDPERALTETAVALASGIQVIYEAAFLHDDVLVRVDILAKGPGGVWDIYEVKSTKDVEDVYLLDAAIQRYVAEGAGMTIGVTHVVHLNPGYVRQGALDLKQLFLAVDVNEETAKILPAIPAELVRMKTTSAMDKPPEVAIAGHCTKPHDCSFIGHCWAKVPDYSVFNLAGARMDKKTDLWNKGIKTIDAIPDCTCKPTAKKCTCGNKLTAYQSIQRRVAKEQWAFINPAGIRELLKQLAYPYHYVDFEAVAPPIPAYDGTRPYQQLPFQASIHYQEADGAPLQHFEYLADGTRDPRPELVDFLRGHIKDHGSVIAYYKSYEGAMLKMLAAMQRDGSQAAADLLSAEARLWDACDAFRLAHWAAPGFEGSYSIKKVLPILVPEMTYKGMAVADGLAAMRAYARLMDPRTTPEERAKIMADLKAYCGQDTLAMVRIVDKQKEAAGTAKEANA